MPRAQRKGMSKLRITWKFCFEKDVKVHEIVLVHSVLSGKKRISFNGREVFSSTGVSALLGGAAHPTRHEHPPHPIAAHHGRVRAPDDARAPPPSRRNLGCKLVR